MKKKVDLLFISSEDSRTEKLVEVLKENTFFPEKIANEETIEQILATKSSEAGSIYCLLNNEKEQLSNEEKILETRLYQALENDEFVMFYQPVIDLSNDSLYGFESLIRWLDPEAGIVPPDSFIPVAERSAIIIPLGFRVIDMVMKQMREWLDAFPSMNHLKAGINLSASQFLYPDLCDRIIEIRDRYRLDSDNIVFEVTESAFMEDMETANIMLLKLKSEKFKIYLDDFGTGYSSLTYLLHFPVDTLKIDKSFVKWMHIDDQSKHIVNSVISMAHNLGMKIVAEGVEEDIHEKLITAMKCDFGQGHFYSKPMPPEEVIEYINNTIGKG